MSSSLRGQQAGAAHPRLATPVNPLAAGAPSARWIDPALGGLAVGLAAIVYFPVTGAYFFADDLLSQVQAINILPREKAQVLHYDDGFYRWPRPRRALGAATIWDIDDFTPENGATVVIPRSHLWDERLPTADEANDARPIVMPGGSVLVFLGTLWHGGGANRSGTSRLCVTAQYCAPWCRPQENFSLSVSPARVRRSSEHLQRLLGYSIWPPFMGFVNGMHPKRVLQEV
jgi:ectoine hydroxylase-related dioxygenase (phytanoyl-CoA dioxygenase family)